VCPRLDETRRDFGDQGATVAVGTLGTFTRNAVAFVRQDSASYYGKPDPRSALWTKPLCMIQSDGTCDAWNRGRPLQLSDNTVVPWRQSTVARSESFGRRVIVYSSNLLPFSEVFIKEQVRSYSRWHAVLAGRNYVPGTSLAGLDTVLIGPSDHLYGRLVPKLYLYFWRSPRATISRAKALSASIIHAHFGPSALEIWPVARALGLPLITTFHGSDINLGREWWESGDGGWAMRFYHPRLLEMAKSPLTHFIAVSEALRRRAIELGIPNHKVTVHYIGTNIDKFIPDVRDKKGPPFRVMFVGRLAEVKGCEYLIRAIALMNQTTDVELVVAGDGPLKNELMRLSVQLGVRAQFLGAIPHDDVVINLRRSHVLSLPSVRLANGMAEGLPMVLVEAQACGVPVIASAIGGTGEAVLDGETGFVIPEKDEYALAQKLDLLMKNNSLLEAMASSARRFAQDRFNIRTCSARLESMYDSICGHPER
jgi:glycosyltransferase involved in cell wall biosynthesis